MRRVTGVGGIFFKARDPEALYAWYERHLGIRRDTDGSGASMRWRDDREGAGMTVFSIFPQHTTYFGPGSSPFMINFRVDDLDALLAALSEEGVQIDPKRDEAEYGKFAWVYDPEGNKIELWQPPD